MLTSRITVVSSELAPEIASDAREKRNILT